MVAGSSAHFLSKQWEHLVTYSVNPDTNAYDSLIPFLAASWTTSSDGLEWTFKLQPEVTWHDGTDFTSADVAFSLETCVNPNSGGCTGATLLGDIVGADDLVAGTATTLSGVTTPDPLTVVIKTNKPNAALLNSLTLIWMVQKASLSSIPIEELATSAYWLTPGQAVGTGPFKLTAYTPNDSMELSRFDEYWRGAPLLDKIVRREYKDPATMLLAFDAGELDMSWLTADEVEREQRNPNARIIAGPSLTNNQIVLNPTVSPAFANKLFAQALLYAIDRDSIIKNLYNGEGELLSCIFGSPENRPPDVNPYAYDPEKARDLISQSGVDMAALPEFTFDTYYNDPLTLNVITTIQQNWADIGFKVTLQQMDAASWRERYYAGLSEISLTGASNGPDGNSASQFFATSAAYPDGSNGWEGYHYSNPQVDALFAQGVETFDPEARAAVYQQICTVLADELPWITLWQISRYSIVSNRIGGFILSPAGGGGSFYDEAESWFVKT